MTLSFGLLLLRVVVGLFIMGHGSQKLFGWFGGNGFAKTSGWLQSMGFKPAWLWALLGSAGEFVGGLLLVLGFLTPLGAIAIFASMLMAVVRFHWSQGFWSTKGGYEYPLILLFMALVIGLIGPGAYAVDALIGFALPLSWYIIGLVLSAIVVYAGILISRQSMVKQAA